MRQEWWSVEEVCTSHGVSPQSVRRALRSGALVGEKSGKHWRVAKSECEKWETEKYPSSIGKRANVYPLGEILDRGAAAKYLSVTESQLVEQSEGGRLRNYGNKFHIVDLDRFILEDHGTVIVPIIGESFINGEKGTIGEIVNGIPHYYDFADEYFELGSDHKSRIVRWPGRPDSTADFLDS